MKNKMILVLAISLLLVGCSNTNSSDTNSQLSNLVNVNVNLDVLDEIQIHTEKQASYLDGSYKHIDTYASGKEELSKPNDVELSWNLESDSSETLKSYTVKISENDDMSNAKSYEVTDSKLLATNFKIGTFYYWSVTANYESTSYTSEISEFYVEDVAPRNVSIEGVTNCRDLGGWVTATGERVKQNMIYRTGRLNQSSSDSVVVEVTENGLDTLINDFGIKSEIDLRKVSNNEVGSITKSVIGDDVNYLSTPMEYNGNIMTINTEQIKTIFNFLADESHYPMIIHCNIGTDRTGMIAYLINGLLGVEEENLYYDYCFSNFGNIGGSRAYDNISSSYGATINQVEGDDLSTKIYNYLLSIGLTEDTLDSIKSIMIE